LSSHHMWPQHAFLRNPTKYQHSGGTIARLLDGGCRSTTTQAATPPPSGQQRLRLGPCATTGATLSMDEMYPGRENFVPVEKLMLVRRIREAPLCANTVDVIILSELSAAEKGVGSIQGCTQRSPDTYLGLSKVCGSLRIRILYDQDKGYHIL